jgi:hypothetical protein
MTLAEKLNLSNRLLKCKTATQKQQPDQQDGNSSNGLIGNKARATTEKLHLSMIQCPVSMTLLFFLTVEALAIAVIEGFIIYYHTMIFSQCKFSLKALGLGQMDLIYHGIFIITPIYKLFLYVDALRQRNSFQLLIFFLFGKCFKMHSTFMTE